MENKERKERVNKEFFNLFFTDFQRSTFHEQISGDMGL